MGPETRALNVPIASPSWPVYGQIVRERKIKRSTHAHVSTCSVSPVEPWLQVPARGHSCWNSSPMILAPLSYRSSYPRIMRACNQTHIFPPRASDTITYVRSNEDGLYFSSPRRKIRARSYCSFFFSLLQQGKSCKNAQVINCFFFLFLLLLLI